MRETRWGRPQIRAVLLSSLVVLSLFAGIPITSDVATAQSGGDATPSLTASDGSVEYDADSGNATVVDDELNTTEGSTTIDGAQASVTGSFSNGDRLSYNETTADEYGISGSYETETGVLSLTGEAAVSEYESVLQTVEFENTNVDPDTDDREIEFRLGANYSAETGHYYAYNSTEVSWTEARGEANSSEYLGQQGYLATVRSTDENNHVYDLWDGDENVWLGATDAGTENEWHWVTGPEGNETESNNLEGVQFWAGTYEGKSVSGEFDNWASDQPNDYQGQDHAGFYSDESNSWQDFTEAGDEDPTINGYVIEYGGRSGDPDVQLADTRTVTVSSSSSLPVNEDFEASTDEIDDWRIVDDAETGVTVDGEQSLRLTSDTPDHQAGTGLYEKSFSTDLGITAEFSYYAAGGDGADGLTFFLLNSSQVDPTGFKTGTSGGSLGYSGDRGISAGYLGVGFDEYGAFADPDEGGHGDGPGRTQQSVTLRGAGDRAGTGETPWYPHLDTIEPTDDIDGGWRDVILTIDPTAGGDGDLGVELQMSWNDGDTWETVVDTTYSEDEIGSSIPEDFYMGFSGSTGSSTNTHAISNADVNVPSNLSTTVTTQPSGSYDRQESVEYEYEITNNGPNNASGIELENTLPTGSEGLTGLDWSYETTDGQTDSGGAVDLSSATVDLDTDETVTVSVSGTVGSEAIGDLDHTVGGSHTGVYSDPDPSSSTAAVAIDIENQPTGLRTDAGDAEYVETTDPVTVAPNLSIIDGGQEVDSATVIITDGYDASTDELGFDTDVATANGISGTVDGSQIVFTDVDGENPGPDDYEAVLQTVTYNSTEDNPSKSERDIAFSLTEDTDSVLYNPETGRYYEHVENESTTWEDARENASDQSHFGMTGYLTTITSEAENDFLREEFEAGGWIGASDAADESVWRWVTGPEGLADGGDGQHFFDQTAGHVAGFGPYEGAKKGNVGGGEAVDGAYTNWDPRHEPNNKFPQFGGQHDGYLCEGPGSCPDGTWKDASADSPPFDADGFFIEYGDLPSDPTANPADDRMVQIIPNTPPTADAGNNVTSEVDAEIEFDASDSSDVVGIDGYKWEFGDGTSYGFDADNETVSYAYADDDEYTLTLTVRDTTGQESIDELGVTIEGPAILIADADANETVDQGESVRFDASESEASEGIDSYQWEFGDGSNDTSERTTHSYSDPGTYTATLTITDEDDNEATATKSVTVKDTTAPEADAGANETTVSQDETVDLDGSGSTDEYSSVERYEWDTDGNGAINETGEKPTVSYDEAGNYTVRLYATDSAGNTGTDTVNITVEDTTDPVADAGENVSATAGERLTFDGTNSSDNVGLDEFEWNFGDGNTTTGASVTHNFSSTGSYDVELTVTDLAGNAQTNNLTVDVTDPPEINTTSGDTSFRQYNGSVVVDPDIEIDSSDYFEGAEVTINNGFAPDSDVLNNTTDVPSGISTSYDAETGVLSLSGNASADDYQTALRNVTYNNTADDPTETDRTITFTLGSDRLYNPATGNYYEFVDDEDIEWDDAREAAADRKQFGLQGYLATVRSEEENDFIADKVNGNGWIGASDRATEGDWHWVTGPEGENQTGEYRGVRFFNQTSSINGEPEATYDGATNGGGDPVDGEYTNWAREEPNHWYGGEDFGHYYASSQWNDFPSDDGWIDGYVVEYGGFDDDPDVQLSDNKTVAVSADEPPAVGVFGSNETTINEGLNFTAANSTDDHGIYGYGWEFGEGEPSYDIDPDNESISHAYDSDGNYTVTLTVEDTANQTSTDTLDVTVKDDTFVIANPGGNVTVDQRESVTLNASSSRASEGIDSYEWDFNDDGKPENGTENATFAGYDDVGTKPVTLNVTDTNGNSSISTTYVHVNDISPPTAVADANVSISDNELTVDEGDVVAFNATDSQKNGTELTDFEWTFPDFSDGQAFDQSEENVTYEFSPGDQPGPGTYLVNLSVTDAAGNTNTTNLSVTINDTTPPTADAGSDLIVERGEAFSFDASGSTDNDAIDSYEWTVPRQGTLTGSAPTATYDRIGKYNASLTVNDSNGYEATDSVVVLVEDTKEPTINEFSLSNPSGQAVEVLLTTDEPLSELSVDLTGPESTTLTAADFDSGEESGTDTYTATYDGSTNGEYEATLESARDDSDNDGADGEAATVTISAPPEISNDDVSMANPDGRQLDIAVDSNQELETLDITLTRDGETVTTFNTSEFEASLSGGSYTYATNYTASEDGKFEVVLDRAENNNGDDGASGQSATVGVDESVEANIRASSSEVSLGSEVEFDASRSSYPSDADYEWTVGPNTESTDENFTHTFDETGKHAVELTITDDENDVTTTDSVTITVEDRTPPVGNLTVNESQPAVGDTVSFDASSSSDSDEVDDYEWSITGDGTVVDSGDGIHNYTYEEPGTFRESVTVTDPSGNEDTEKVRITVQGGNATMDTERVDFGSATINSTNTTSLDIENDGTAPLNITEATFDDPDDPFELVGSAADSLPVIAPGETRAVGVGFAPTTASMNETNLTLKHNASHQADFNLKLNGEGVRSTISATDSTQDFGDVSVGSSTDETITLWNNGTVDVDIQDVSITGSTPDAFEVVDDGDLPGEIGAGSNATPKVEFEPVKSGEQTANLRIEAEDRNVTVVSLTGTGNGPEIGVSDDDVDFGDVGTGANATESVRISNYGSQPLDIENATLEGGDRDRFTVTDTPPTVAPNSNESVIIEFAAEDAGNYSTALDIAHNDSASGTQRVDMNATAVAPSADADPRNVDFGNVSVGETVTSSITVTNLHTSLSNLSVESTSLVGEDADDFEVNQSSDAPFEIAPGDSRDILVDFSPSEPAGESKKAQLQVMSNAGNGPQIDVWLSNTKTYVVVQEVDADADKDSAEVDLDAKNVEEGTEFDINVSKPGTRATAMGFDTVSTKTDYEGDFEMDFTHQSTPVNHTLDVEDRETTQYVQQNYTIDGEEFDETSFEYRVKADSLPDGADPESVTFNRYNTTQDKWVSHDSTLERDGSSHYVFSVDTPGFSEFAVTVPESSGDGSGSDDSDPSTSPSGQPSAQPDEEPEPDTDTADTEPTNSEPEPTNSEPGSTDSETSTPTGDAETGTAESDESIQVLGITLTPTLAFGLGGLSLVTGTLGALFLLGRQRTQQYRIAIGSDDDVWSRMAVAAALEQRDERDLTEDVDIVAVSADSNDEPKQQPSEMPPVEDSGIETVTSITESGLENCDLIVWAGEPPIEFDEFDDGIELVDWPTPDRGSVSVDEIQNVDSELNQRVAALVDRVEE